MTVDAAGLAAIGATATPARFTLGRAPDALIIEGVEARLVRGGG